MNKVSKTVVVTLRPCRDNIPIIYQDRDEETLAK